MIHKQIKDILYSPRDFISPTNLSIAIWREWVYNHLIYLNVLKDHLLLSKKISYIVIPNLNMFDFSMIFKILGAS